MDVDQTVAHQPRVSLRGFQLSGGVLKHVFPFNLSFCRTNFVSRDDKIFIGTGDRIAIVILSITPNSPSLWSSQRYSILLTDLTNCTVEMTSGKKKKWLDKICPLISSKTIFISCVGS